MSKKIIYFTSLFNLGLFVVAHGMYEVPQEQWNRIISQRYVDRYVCDPEALYTGYTDDWRVMCEVNSSLYRGVSVKVLGSDRAVEYIINPKSKEALEAEARKTVNEPQKGHFKSMMFSLTPYQLSERDYLPNRWHIGVQ